MGMLHGMRVALVALVAALAALAAAVIFVLEPGKDTPAAPAPKAAPPSFEQLTGLVERISRDKAGLIDQGIYVMTASLGEDCAAVGLANPTQPNVAFVERQFRGTCVASAPAPRPETCEDGERTLTQDGRIEVPDLRDLTLAQASRRVLAEDLTYAADCLGAAETEPWVPQGAPDELARVVEQCPRPGELVRAGTEVALDAVVVLPGDFRHRISALDGAGETPCSDGRNP
jgi:hypothetical protein